MILPSPAFFTQYKFRRVRVVSAYKYPRNPTSRTLPLAGFVAKGAVVRVAWPLQLSLILVCPPSLRPCPPFAFPPPSWARTSLCQTTGTLFPPRPMPISAIRHCSSVPRSPPSALPDGPFSSLLPSGLVRIPPFLAPWQVYSWPTSPLSGPLAT